MGLEGGDTHTRAPTRVPPNNWRTRRPAAGTAGVRDAPAGERFADGTMRSRRHWPSEGFESGAKRPANGRRLRQRSSRTYVTNTWPGARRRSSGRHDDYRIVYDNNNDVRGRAIGTGDGPRAPRRRLSISGRRSRCSTRRQVCAVTTGCARVGRARTVGGMCYGVNGGKGGGGAWFGATGGRTFGATSTRRRRCRARGRPAQWPRLLFPFDMTFSRLGRPRGS